ncbi:hypothetical protein ACIBRY_00425 [Streptomyces anulatus]
MNEARARFYELRHTGNTLSADTGAKLRKDLMVRAVQSSERARLICQHSTKGQQHRLAADIDLGVRRQQSAAASGSGGATIHPLVPRPPGPSAESQESAPPGADLARDAWTGPDNKQGPGR